MKVHGKLAIPRGAGMCRGGRGTRAGGVRQRGRHRRRSPGRGRAGQRQRRRGAGVGGGAAVHGEPPAGPARSQADRQPAPGDPAPRADHDGRGAGPRPGQRAVPPPAAAARDCAARPSRAAHYCSCSRSRDTSPRSASRTRAVPASPGSGRPGSGPGRRGPASCWPGRSAATASWFRTCTRAACPQGRDTSWPGRDRDGVTSRHGPGTAAIGAGPEPSPRRAWVGHVPAVEEVDDHHRLESGVREDGLH